MSNKKAPEISIKDILEKTPNKKIIIDLSTEMGNIDILISVGVSWCKSLKLNHKKFMVSMIESDYNSALDLFQKHFDFVIFNME